jgi:hypothetical protein
MGDPDVRALLGISNEAGRLSLVDGVNPYLLAVLHDLVVEGISVGKIYSKDDRRKYIEELRARVDQQLQPDNPVDTSTYGTPGSDDASPENRSSPPSDGTGSGAGVGENPPPPASSTPTGRRSYPVNRRTLIPQHHRLSISHPRIVKIFTELKSLDIETYPNACAVLFRVFVELSADCYIAKNSLSGINVDSKLGKKLEAIITDFEGKSIMTAHELRSAKQMSSSSTQTNSVKTFHTYVHNMDVTPSSADLKSAWDDLWTFTENIWR